MKLVMVTTPERVLERGELRARGQLTVEQEVGGLLERALLGEVLDPDSPVLENAVLPVDEPHTGLRRDDAGQSRDEGGGGDRV